MVIARNGYTAQEIIDALLDERRELDFRIDLLDSANGKLKEITTIDALTVSYDKESRDVNRALKASFKDDLGFTERFEFDHSSDWISYGDALATWDWQTADSQLASTGGNEAKLIRDEFTYTDVDIEVDCTWASDGGIVARFQDNNNYYLCAIRDDSSALPTQNIQVYKRVNGAYTSLGSADVSFVRGISHTIRFRVIGSRLQASFDGTVVVDVTDTAITSAGGIGLRANGSRTTTVTLGRYDDFIYEDSAYNTYNPAITTTTGENTVYQEIRVTSKDTIDFLKRRLQPHIKLLMPALTSYTATTQADFQAGTLTSVTANSNGTLTLGASAPFNASGNWVSPAYSVDAVGYLKKATISWSATVPAACTLTVDIKVGSGSFQRATNGGPVPGLSVGDDLTGKTVTLKVSMTTSDTSQTATLDDISIRFLSSNNSAYIEFAQGIFVIPTARPSSNIGGTVTYQLDGFDLNHLLGDTAVKDRYYLPAGTNYVSAIKAALATAGITSYNITASTAVLSTSQEWEPGTSIYQIVDELCAGIGYVHYFDENGTFVALQWANPQEQAPIFSFKTDKLSLVEPEASLELDAYGVPNTVVLIVSEPELTSPLRAERSNNNADSPVSIPSRGREIVRVIKDVQAPDQTTLDQIATQRLFELSQIYESVELNVGIVPFMGHGDSIDLEFDPFRLRARYEVLSWEIDMAPGGKMMLHVRRIVTV